MALRNRAKSSTDDYQREFHTDPANDMGTPMDDETGSNRVTHEELIVSTQARIDSDIKLLIQKGLITEAEAKGILAAECANYLAVLKRLR